MTASEVIREVAKTSGLTIKDTTKFMRALEEVVETHIATEDEIRVFNGLKVGTKMAAARKYRNPQTGELETIAAHKAGYTKLGKRFKDIVKDNAEN